MKKSIPVLLVLTACVASAGTQPGVVNFPLLVIPGTATPNKPVVKQITFSGLNTAGNLAEWDILCDYTSTPPAGAAPSKTIGFSLTASGNTVTGYAGTHQLDGKTVPLYTSGFYSPSGVMDWTNVAPAVANPPTYTISNVDQSTMTLDCWAEFKQRLPN